MEPQKVAAVYTRVSTQGQVDGYSLADQEKAGREEAQRRGLLVLKTIADPAESSMEIDRPGLNELRKLVRQGRVQYVIVWKLDRLARDMGVFNRLLGEFADNDCELISVTEEELSGAVGKLVTQVRGFANEAEREKITERTKRGRRSRAESGKLIPSGKPLYGYVWADREKSRYVIHEPTAAIVRRIYQEVLSGYSLHAITRRLNSEGVPPPAMHMRVEGSTRPVGEWGKAAVQRILAHPFYTGTATAFHSLNVKEKRREETTNLPYTVRAIRRRDEEDIVRLPEGTVPPIVDDATAYAVSQRLQLNKQQQARNTRNPEDYLLRSGYAVCGLCGGNLHVVKFAKEPYPVYRCQEAKDGRHIPGHESVKSVAIYTHMLDTSAWQFVYRVIEDEDYVRAVRARMRGEVGERVEETTAALTSVQKQMQTFERQVKNLTSTLMNAEDEDTRALMQMQLDNTMKAKRALQKELDKLTEERGAEKNVEGQIESMEEAFAQMRRMVRMPNIPYPVKRLILHGLNVKATLYPHGGKPRFTLSCDLAGFSLGLSRELFEMTDTELEAMKPEKLGARQADFASLSL